MFNFDHNCGGTYTSNNGVNIKIDIFALFKLMKKIPSPPKICKMNFALFTNSLLSNNTIIMSKDIADALENTLKEETNE